HRSIASASDQRGAHAATLRHVLVRTCAQPRLDLVPAPHVCLLVACSVRAAALWGQRGAVEPVDNRPTARPRRPGGGRYRRGMAELPEHLQVVTTLDDRAAAERLAR